MDEIWTFIGNKTNVAWITYTIERKSRRIVGFVLGPKTKENIQPLVNELILSVPQHIYTVWTKHLSNVDSCKYS